MVGRNKIPLARYLFTRLRQQGVQAIYGVPGDFTLKALDHVPPAGLKWIGTCNELNGGYAADGYARVHGLSAIMTTYGVGELSAINAIAGSFAEWVPVVSIVGTPQRRLQDGRKNVHHTLGNGRPRVFAAMARHVTVAQTNLVDESTAADEVDRVIATSLRESRPVYVEMPADMVGKEVDAARLDEKIDVAKGTVGNESEEEILREEVLDRIYNARQPLLLVDSGGGVRALRDEINAFVKTTGIPTMCMPSGNNMVDHSHANFYGVHSGPVGQIDTMPYVRDTDLVLAFGPMFSDTQTLSWKVVPKEHKIITLNRNTIHILGLNGGEVAEIDLSRFLKGLTEQFDRSRLTTPDVSSLGDFRTVQPPAYAKPDGVTLDDSIDQTSFYLRLSPYLRPHDTVILGNATPILGGRDLVLPPNAQIIASGQWFSIGHMFPLSMGVSLARQYQSQEGRPPGRTILLDGDGGFQVTAQELGTVIRYRIPMTIFLINNAGYAYERQIHGMHEDYNDLAPWRYTELARVFGATEAQLVGSKTSQNVRKGELYTVRNYTIRTWRDLENLLADEEFCEGKGLHFVDVRVGKFDVPEKFRVVFERAGEALGS